MAPAGVEEQRMGMRRRLRVRMRSATCLLENAAGWAQAAVLCNGKEVVDCAAVSGHGEHLSIRREGQMPGVGCGKRQRRATHQGQAAVKRIDVEGFDGAPRQSLVRIYV